MRTGRVSTAILTLSFSSDLMLICACYTFVIFRTITRTPAVAEITDRTLLFQTFLLYDERYGYRRMSGIAMVNMLTMAISELCLRG